MKCVKFVNSDNRYVTCHAAVNKGKGYVKEIHHITFREFIKGLFNFKFKADDVFEYHVIKNYSNEWKITKIKKGYPPNSISPEINSFLKNIEK